MKKEPPSLRKIEGEVLKIIKEARAKREKIMKDTVTAYIRTYAPVLAAGIITLLAGIGLDLGAYSEAIAGIIGTIGGFLYYALARWIGKKLPQVEKFMLGSSKTPHYGDK